MLWALVRRLEDALQDNLYRSIELIDAADGRHR